MTALEPVIDPATTFARAAVRVSPLLELDPDLGRDLAPARRRTALRDLPVRVVNVDRGPWSPERFETARAGHLGFLVVGGLLGRELLADDVASMELLGPGDALRPWVESGDFELLRAVVRWSALAQTRLAILDRHLAARLAGYPEIHCALLERFAWRTRRLAVLQAISQLNRVDRRLLTLLWHLAERWGRVTPDGRDRVVPVASPTAQVGAECGVRGARGGAARWPIGSRTSGDRERPIRPVRRGP